MKSSQMSLNTHKHYHYHYHYDINDKYLHELGENYSFPSIVNPQKSYLTPIKGSWRDHINPEVTKRYQEISIHQSFDQEFTPKASRFTQTPIRNQQNIASVIGSKKNMKTRTQILSEIRSYEEYLKKHSQPNIFVPTMPSLRRFKSTDCLELPKNNTVSLNQILEQNQSKKINLEEMVGIRAESRRVSNKNQLSTFCETSTPQQFYFSKNKFLNARQSEIKNPSSSSNIFQKARIRMSHIEDPTHKQNIDELENSNFSLFQRQVKKELSEKSCVVLQNPLKSEVQNLFNEEETDQNRKNAGNLEYAFELMRQECNFLRNKYIEHAENKHGAKF